MPGVDAVAIAPGSWCYYRLRHLTKTFPELRQGRRFGFGLLRLNLIRLVFGQTSRNCWRVGENTS